MNLAAALVAFPVVFVGELPDKTMFASLVLATRGRPVQVWIGAAAAFVVHVAIAVTIGVALVALLPRRVTDAVVAAVFFAGAAWAWRSARSEEGDDEVPEQLSGRRVALSAFAVIFAAEWGDLTQLLTADLAARTRAPFAVAVGAVAALWLVAAGAVGGGRLMLRLVSVRRLRQATAVAMLAMAAWAALAAAG